MRVSIIAACLIAGLATAYITTAKAVGQVGIPDLPGLGYTVGVRGEPVGALYCINYYVLSGNGAPETLIGDLPPTCSTVEQEQQRIDALLANYPPPGAAPITTTVYGTTTTLVTVALPAPLPPPVPEVPTVRETVTQTVIAPTVVADPPWLVALSARSAWLNAFYGLGN